LNDWNLVTWTKLVTRHEIVRRPQGDFLIAFTRGSL
jgi:hypothetical protein